MPLVRTPQEQTFLANLLGSRSLDVWLHEGSKGKWPIVSKDCPEEGTIRATLRLDFDGSSIRGGWSPANLNWDDGVALNEPEIDTPLR
jgi:hypothetical protein